LHSTSKQNDTCLLHWPLPLFSFFQSLKKPDVELLYGFFCGFSSLQSRRQGWELIGIRIGIVVIVFFFHFLFRVRFGYFFCFFFAFTWFCHRVRLAGLGPGSTTVLPHGFGQYHTDLVGILRMDSFFYRTNLVEDLRISRFYQINRVFIGILRVSDKKTRNSDQKNDFLSVFYNRKNKVPIWGKFVQESCTNRAYGHKFTTPIWSPFLADLFFYHNLVDKTDQIRVVLTKSVWYHSMERSYKIIIFTMPKRLISPDPQFNVPYLGHSKK